MPELSTYQVSDISSGVTNVLKYLVWAFSEENVWTIDADPKTSVRPPFHRDIQVSVLNV